MTRKKRPVIFGEVLFDHFPDGTKALGGAPFNVAWHLQGFGCDPLFISRVGDDAPGRRVREMMIQWGMDTAGLQVDSDRPTGTVRVTMDAGEPAFEIVPDQAYDTIEAEPALDIVRHCEPVLLYHGSLVVRSKTSAAALDVLKEMYPRRNFVDLNLRKPWWDRTVIEGMAADARWLKLNREELRILEEAPDGSEKRMMDLACRRAEGYGNDFIIVTLGRQGAFISLSEHRAVTVPAVQINGFADSVGAGDAFSAVAIMGILHGWNHGSMLRRAVRFAAEVCRYRGALITNRADYGRIMREWTSRASEAV